jgi:hypothetical protein
MKKWEYQIETNCNNEDLNFYGNDGWELFALIRQEGPNEDINWFYFKRPIEEQL